MYGIQCKGQQNCTSDFMTNAYSRHLAKKSVYNSVALIEFFCKRGIYKIVKSISFKDVTVDSKISNSDVLCGYV